MFYGYEKTFKSIEHLEQAIVDYINYDNNKRIKIKLKLTRHLFQEECYQSMWDEKRRVLKMTSLKQGII